MNEKSARIGHWLGVATMRGKHMSYWILPYSGVPVVCSSIQHITKDEACDPKYQELLLAYDKQIKKTKNVNGKAIDLSGLKPWDLIDIDFPTDKYSSDVVAEADDYDVSK